MTSMVARRWTNPQAAYRVGRRTGTDAAPRDVEYLSWIMDDLFRIPGVNWRVGLDPILGLVPGVGDLITAGISLYILLAAVHYGAPKITLLRMGLNIGIDLLVGAIPFVG